jgi:hypothetical protein
MTIWVPLFLALAAGFAWLEYQRPNRSHLLLRVLAAAIAVAALAVLVLVPRGGGTVIVLTPGAPLASHSRQAVSLDQVQSLAAVERRAATIRLAGWGLLPHEWPDGVRALAGFERADLPFGIVRLDSPTEVGVGEPLPVRGRVNLAGEDSAWVLLEDPSGPRDSARVAGDSSGFTLMDRPRAPGAAPYRLRIRSAHHLESAETLGVAVQPEVLPSLLILDGSPSFETGFLKRWLGERGARVAIRTAISRDRFRTETLNGATGEIGGLTEALLARYDAVLADGETIAGLSPEERKVLDDQVRSAGLGLLITADAPWLVARRSCGLLNGYLLDPIEAAGDKRDRRVSRPTVRNGARRSRTGIETETVSLKPAGIEPLVHDEVGRVMAAWRRAGGGRVALTLLRTPSRWLLEGEPDQYASYWYAMIRAVARDTTTRVFIGAEGPVRPDHPVLLSLATRGSERDRNRTPKVSVRSPEGSSDAVALAQDPFDPARWSGRYWPRTTGWHRLELAGSRAIPFRVGRNSEWVGLEASARLAATVPRIQPAESSSDGARGWQTPLAFFLLVGALGLLWTESRLT